MSVRNTTALVIALVLAVIGCGRDQDTPPQESDTAAGSSDSGTTGDDECLGADGCYACDPQDNVQLLDHCTDADCEPFANTPERLPRIEADGSLPPIP